MNDKTTKFSEENKEEYLHDVENAEFSLMGQSKYKTQVKKLVN